MPEFNEFPVTFECCEEELVGIVHQPHAPAETGVLVVVGGPQYRAGSHRQFVLLARFLAEKGIPVLRFDYRGMGDSSGALRTFEDVSRDIGAAIDKFMEVTPSLKRVVLWGLCDAASAALFYGYRDPRIAGLVLLNPWVRTESGEAKTYLKHYYLSRLMSAAFWKKVLSGQFKAGKSFKEAADNAKKATGKSNEITDTIPLPERMLRGLGKFEGNLLFILSGNDLTADEFRDLISSSRDWKRTLKQKKAIFKELPEANHTFSSAEWRGQVEQWTLDWVNSIS